MAVLGRPNTGKSLLISRLSKGKGEEEKRGKEEERRGRGEEERRGREEERRGGEDDVCAIRYAEVQDSEVCMCMCVCGCVCERERMGETHLFL